MSEIASPGLFDRAVRRIQDVWRDMASAVAREEDDSIAAQMRACLEGRGGEVSARNRAAKLAQAYLALDEVGRRAFLATLAGFDSDPDAVAAAYDSVRAATDPAERATAKAALRRVLDPPRARLLTQFAAIPDGVKFLVDLRAALLDVMRGDRLLTALESDFRALLASWFDVGFLDLQRIDWNSSAALLEKLAGYEAVHGIRSWRDMKNRLDADRRCYAFFHPRMPTEPLIFVEVALVKGLAGSVQSLLDPKAPLIETKDADTAIFYSISNCQRGLAGISFGNFLIKRVVEELSGELRGLKTFATLSPVPGFRRWLEAALEQPDPAVLTEADAATLRAALALGAPASARQAAETPLLRLCARYLLVEGKGRRALDPVAHFHLSNGARLERMLFAADTSVKGVRESVSIMVNYLYDPAKIEQYHEDYAGEGRRNAATPLRRLARAGG
jgi:malonyl-CoA decarboxylase